MVSPDALDPSQHRRVRTPTVPEELEHCDHNGDADSLDGAEDGDARKAHHREPKLPSLNFEKPLEVIDLEQANRRGDDDCGQRGGGNVLQKVGCR
jgi:hypothetical protein